MEWCHHKFSVFCVLCGKITAAGKQVKQEK